MKFTKMHGLGNDYVFINTFNERVDHPPTLARVVSDRRVGIGGDGLILIAPSRHADVRMEVYNADGSRAEMCGNGIRCVAKYAAEHGLLDRSSSGRSGEEGHEGPVVRVETDAGVKLCQCQTARGGVRSVRVDMGIPSLDPAVVGFSTDGRCGSTLDRIVNHPLRIHSSEPQASACANFPRQFAVTCVSMGNPHAVVFVDDLDAVALELVGPRFEHAPEFPNGINTHFVRVDSPQRVTIKTWERGSGATRACGTGACAVCVAGVLTDRTKRKIVATLPGGDLDVEWGDDDHVYMTGPATEAFTGDWPD